MQVASHFSNKYQYHLFAVSSISETQTLRQLGICKPIRVNTLVLPFGSTSEIPLGAILHVTKPLIWSHRVRHTTRLVILHTFTH